MGLAFEAFGGGSLGGILFPLRAVWEEIPADLETPVSVYKKTAGRGYSYLLESVDGGERVARYSIIGFDPLLIFRAKGDAVKIEGGGGNLHKSGDPLEALKQLISGLQVGPLPAEPRFFGGAVGYFGYDLVRHFERLPGLAADDLGLPDCFFVITRKVLIYDHARRTLKILVFEPAGEKSQAEEAISSIKDRLRAELPQEKRERRRSVKQEPVSNISRERFMEAVCRAREYIRSGEIFQVVLSQRFQQEIGADPFSVYRLLRTINPSPYMFCLDFGELRLIGSSPEMLVRVENGWVETHPIAGTRPRGETPEADDALAREMESDPKERAEHLMLVDLGRNDLGRVCEYGSVRVTRYMENERYSHVMHLVSVVKGKLKRGSDAFDALRACFPAGTVSGAPKVRAMEIIEELEPTRRGPYAGAVGYISFNGNLDSCITIRTIVVQGNTAYVQAGAGIVADSDPEREYQETLNKAGALLKALSLAEEGEGR